MCVLDHLESLCEVFKNANFGQFFGLIFSIRLIRGSTYTRVYTVVCRNYIKNFKKSNSNNNNNNNLTKIKDRLDIVNVLWSAAFWACLHNIAQREKYCKHLNMAEPHLIKKGKWLMQYRN
jgi:hypothetical protein